MLWIMLCFTLLSADYTNHEFPTQHGRMVLNNIQNSIHGKLLEESGVMHGLQLLYSGNRRSYMINLPKQHNINCSSSCNSLVCCS